MDNVFFFNHIMNMGGTESFLYYLAKKYKDRSITIYYRTADAEQLDRLRQYVEVKRYDGEKVKCKKAFFCYTNEYIDNVEAKEYIQMIHADFKAQGKRPHTHPKITRYIAVSQSTADSFTELTGKPCEVCYNPVSLENDKTLVLVSATRLSKEKGQKRMEKFANALTTAGISFIWFVFTNSTVSFSNKNIVVIPPRKDITQFLRIADWFVQLSDCEAFCYSVVEANVRGVPCITTPLKVFDELGTKGVRIGFDIDDIPIDEIKKPSKVKYSAPADRWSEILTRKKSTYTPPPKSKSATVTVIKDYMDVMTGRREKRGTRLTVSTERAQELRSKGVAR